MESYDHNSSLTTPSVLKTDTVEVNIVDCDNIETTTTIDTTKTITIIREYGPQISFSSDAITPTLAGTLAACNIGDYQTFTISSDPSELSIDNSDPYTI